MTEHESRHHFESWINHKRQHGGPMWLCVAGTRRWREDLGTKYSGEYESIQVEVAWQAWEEARKRMEVAK